MIEPTRGGGGAGSDLGGVGGGGVTDSESELPSTWLSLKLGDVLAYGKTEKAEPEEIAPETWVLELEDVEKDTTKVLQHLTFAERQSKSTKNKFNAGDVLYGKLRPYLNKVTFADRPGVCTTEIVPIKPNEAVHGRYLFHWLRHPAFLTYVTEVSHGVNMPRLGTDAGRDAPFVLAPKAEQKRVADKLDTVLTRVDAVNTRLARVAPLLKRFRQSVLAAATSGRLTEDWRGGRAVNETWRVIPLGKYVENHDGARVPISETLRTERRGAYPYYGASGVIDTIDGFTHEGKFVLIGEDGANLVTRSKPIAFIATGKIWVNNHAHVLKCKEGASDEYLAYYINSIDLTPYVSGSAQPKLNQKNLNTIPVPVPPTEEQTEIVRRVETLFAFADRLEARLAQAQTAATRLTPALLAKAFRGELVPQDPNDEPAAELLRRLASSPTAPAKRGRAAKAT
jgi:type I restriction enzyme S subunit